MSLTINNYVGSLVAATPSNKPITTTNSHLSLLHRQSPPFSLSLSLRHQTHIVFATGKSTSRTGKFDSKNRRNSATTTEEESEERKKQQSLKNFENNEDLVDGAVADSGIDDGYFLPDLPGGKQDFWEGPQWDGFGFFVQYMWAFGILFAVIRPSLGRSRSNIPFLARLLKLSIVLWRRLSVS